MINEKTKIYNNISIKKGLRSKQATTKYNIKKRIKEINRQQQYCKQLFYVYRDLVQVHSPDCSLCDIKGKTEQATGFNKNSVNLVWRYVTWKENSCGLKISVIKIYWTIVIVYAEEV